MPMTITLDDALAKRLTAMAAGAKHPPEAVAITLLDGLVDQIRFEDGLPVHNMPPDAPPITTEDVNRILYGEAPEPHEDKRIPKLIRWYLGWRRGRAAE